MSEGWILTGNVFPKVPYTTCADFRITVWCMVLITINCSFCTASVCDKYEVIFCQNDTSFLSIYFTFNCRCNLFVSFVEIFVFCHEEFHDFHTALLTEVEFSVCMCVFTMIYSCAAKGIVRVMFIEPVIFIKYRNTRCLDGWNAAEEIPQTFEMIFHLTSTAHYITSGSIIDSITCTTGKIHCF